MKRIIITGTPGTGKTEVSKILAKRLGLPLTTINDVVKKKKLVIGVDEVRGSKMVNLKKLRKELLKIHGVIEGHLACEFSLPGSIVFVLRCSPKTLHKRMKKRKYKERKIMENKEAEALDYCTILAETHYKQVYEVDTTKKKPLDTVEKILKILKKRAVSEKVDYSDYLLESP